MFKVGDAVKWTGSINAGQTREYVGLVEVVLLPGESPDPAKYLTLLRRYPKHQRAEVSYLVRVFSGCDGIYWPTASRLRRTSRSIIVTSRAHARRICGHQSGHEPPYFCTREAEHTGHHTAFCMNVPIMAWDNRGKEK